MEFTLDLHTHTVASGHAYSTVQEMAKAAADKGLKLLGITEHAQGIPGTCDEIYFHNMRIIPRKMYGIDLMFGSEINIIDHDGTLSMEEKIIEKTLDIRIAGIHLPCYEVGTVTQNTNAYVKAIENPMIDIISHPDDSRIPIDYETIVDAAKENHTLLEINNSSLDSLSSRVGAWQNLQIMLQMCHLVRHLCILFSFGWHGVLSSFQFLGKKGGVADCHPIPAVMVFTGQNPGTAPAGQSPHRSSHRAS